MNPQLLVERVLDDERLTADLEGADAEIMNRCLIEHAERIARKETSEARARAAMEALCKKAQLIGRLMRLLRESKHAEAEALSAAQGWPWPIDSSLSNTLQALLESEPV